MRYLLDTNICIYLINHRPGYENISRQIANKKYGDILISTITRAELRFGIAKSVKREESKTKLELFLARFEMASFDNHAADLYGEIRAFLEKQGTPIGPLDTLIAAQTLSLDATLVTNNTKEFSRIPQLKLENWLLA